MINSLESFLSTTTVLVNELLGACNRQRLTIVDRLSFLFRLVPLRPAQRMPVEVDHAALVDVDRLGLTRNPRIVSPREPA